MSAAESDTTATCKLLMPKPFDPGTLRVRSVFVSGGKTTRGSVSAGGSSFNRVSLKRRGAKVMITGRTPERAAELAQRLECSAVEWDLRHGLRPEVLINCTPVGMHPHVDESPFDREYLQPSMLVFDTVYNPENTLLVKEARGRNCTVITGVEMIVRQAALQFKLFTGQDPPWELMRDTLKRAIGPVKY